MPTKSERKGAVLTIHQSYDRGEGKDKDGGQRGHIIVPNWALNLPCIGHGLQNIQNLILIFWDWG
jgi:hypothetical protein